jgi:hypothetical protein
MQETISENVSSHLIPKQLDVVANRAWDAGQVERMLGESRQEVVENVRPTPGGKIIEKIAQK